VRGALTWVALVGALSGGCAHSPDPWERMNRGTFWFNERVADRFVLEPAGRAWNWALPERVQESIGNFFDNLGVPVIFVNDLLQAKPLDAGEDLARLLVNTTVGVAGFFDPASRFGLPRNDEDFGQTLGRWGLPGGPYLVIPILGPSNPRDAVGAAGDWAATPYHWFLPFAVNAGMRSVEAVNLRAAFLEEIEQNRREAFDYYVFVRNAYLENRAHRIADEEVSEEVEEDLYFLDEEEEL
jgi:phospholipid-binding lipoprotein MlaA